MSFVADDIAAWLIGLLADAARRRLATWIFGTEQERALRDAAAAAVWAVAREFRPDADAGTEELARVISQVWDIYLTGVDLRSTLQNPQVRPGSGPPRPTLAARC